MFILANFFLTMHLDIKINPGQGYRAFVRQRAILLLRVGNQDHFDFVSFLEHDVTTVRDEGPTYL